MRDLLASNAKAKLELKEDPDKGVHRLLEIILVDALCFLKVLGDRCLSRSAVTRTHAPR